MQKKLGVFLLLAGLFVFVTALPGNAAAPFFEKKTIRMVVGFPAGGGFDITARVLAPYLAKYIPGNPTVIVENMPGASSLIAANYIYNRGSRDGLTIGMIHGSLVLQQLLGGEGINFDARKYEHIGALEIGTGACAFTKKSGITNMEKWVNASQPVKLGGNVAGSFTSDVPRVLEMALNLPIKLVEGHKGVPDIRLAAERGEVAGLCSPWDSLKVSWMKEIEAGEVVVVLQVAAKKHSDLPNVPLASDYAKTEDGRRLIKAGLIDPARIFRTLVCPPNTPADRVQILGKAFLGSVRDPKFLEAAEKARIEVDPLSIEDVKKIITELLETPPNLQAKLKDILVTKK